MKNKKAKIHKFILVSFAFIYAFINNDSGKFGIGNYSKTKENTKNNFKSLSKKIMKVI